MVFKRIADSLAFLFSYRRKIYKLRKKYDKTREKVDKERGRDKRLSALKVLDQVEPTLVMLEEHDISRFERGRMARYVNSGIAQAKRNLKGEIQHRYPKTAKR